MKHSLLLLLSILFCANSAKAEITYYDRYDFYDEEYGLYLCRVDPWGYDYEHMLVCNRGTYYDSQTSHNYNIITYSGDVVIPEYVMNGEAKIHIVGIQSGAFGDCTELTSVNIGSSVESIGYGAFYGCSSLKSITIPNTVKSIGSSAFQDCTSLSEISIPDGIEMEDTGGMFDGCSSLKKVKLPAGITTLGTYMFRKCTSLEEFIVPETVTNMYSSIFEGCTSLKKLKLPSNLENIPRDMCYECTALTDVEIGNKVRWVGMSAFMRCDNLESLRLPDCVEEMEIAVVRECSKLKDFHIPRSLKAIPAFMFSNCYSLPETMVIPGNVKKIGSAAFQECHNMKAIILEEGVEELDYNAFHQCTKLLQATLPSTMKVVHHDAFQQCVPDDLAILCYAVTPPDTKGEFIGNGHFKVYVPEESVDAYYASDWWKKVEYDWYTYTNIMGIYPMTQEMVGIESVTNVSGNDGALYDISGRRVQTPVRGNMYIKGGKKILF